MPNVVIYKIDLYRDFAAGVLSVWCLLPSYDPYSLPPPYTVYTCSKVYLLYTDRERGGGGANQGEG